MNADQLWELAPFVAFGLIALAASGSALGAVVHSVRRERAVHGELINLREARARIRRGGR